MNRRNFAKVWPLASWILASAVPVDRSMAPLCPPAYRRGMKVGIVAPASPVSRTEWQRVKSSLEAIGFTLVYDEAQLLDNKHFLAGSDATRVAALHRLFQDPEVGIIWCVRGGYGTMRLLDGLDYDLIRRNPKILIGFSDITALLHAIWQRTGLITFHGPVGTSEFTAYTQREMSHQLMSGRVPHTIALPAIVEQSMYRAAQHTEYQAQVLAPGMATGRLIGGNLTLMASLLGTPYDVDYRGKILLLEEVGEAPYRIDRLLTQLRLAGKLDEVAGIGLGVFKDCSNRQKSGELLQVLRDRLGDLGVPVVYGLAFGHVANNFTFPIGVAARLDAQALTLTLLESGVAG